MSKESSIRFVQDSSSIRQEGKNSVDIKPQLADSMQQANRFSIKPGRFQQV